MSKPNLRTVLPAVILPAVGIAVVLVIALSRRAPEAEPSAPAEPSARQAAQPADAAPVESRQPARVAPFRAWEQATADSDNPLPADWVKKLGDIRTRAAAARMLGEQKDRRACTYLRPYCADADATVRRSSIWALGEIGDMRSAMEISTRTGDPESDVRLEVAAALSKLAAAENPSEPVVSGLAESLKSEELPIRLEAARGLAKCKDDRGIQALVAFLGHADPAVRKSAEDGLRGVGEEMIPALTEALRNSRSNEDTLRNVRLLAIFKRKESAPTLVGVLEAVCQQPLGAQGSKDPPPVRQACVDALAALGPEILPELDKRVVSARCKLGLKEAGADVLKRFGSASVATISRRILSRQIFPEELELKLWIDTLAEIGDPAAAPALSSALTKPVNDKPMYKRIVDEAVKKIEAKSGAKLALPPAPSAQEAG